MMGLRTALTEAHGAMQCVSIWLGIGSFSWRLGSAGQVLCSNKIGQYYTGTYSRLVQNRICTYFIFRLNDPRSLLV